MPRRVAAWTVHALTASGAVLSLLALDAIARADWFSALLWMTAAMLVDSFDGMLARWARVRDALPGFDGGLLDNLVDYLGYVVVPAFWLLRGELLPAAAALPTAGIVLLASGYQFAQGDAKTHDHFFKGFPSFWNVAVLYLFFLRLPAAWNLAVVLVLAVGVFVPLKWAYPSRTPRFRALTLGLSLLWGLSVLGILAGFPAPPAWLLYGSLTYFVYYGAVSLYLSRSSASTPAR